MSAMLCASASLSRFRYMLSHPFVFDIILRGGGRRIMLDQKTRKFLVVLSSAERQWVSKSYLEKMGIDVSILNIKHLEALNYVEASIHLDEQYRITPTGETALIEHNRALRSDRKATIAIILSALAIFISLFSLFSGEQQERQSQEAGLSQKQQVTHQEEYRASVLEAVFS